MKKWLGLFIGVGVVVSFINPAMVIAWGSLVNVMVLIMM